MYFRYDGETPIGFEYNDEQYYYVTNLQGDIIAILNSSGNCVAEYTYDAWGNCTIISDIDGIAEVNPLRYRGYYFDSDTDMYYLQSRYYDANVGRFINSDDSGMLMENQNTMVQYNLFVYCDNNSLKHINQTNNFNGMIYDYSSLHVKPTLTNLHGHVFTAREFHDESEIIMNSIYQYFDYMIFGQLCDVDNAREFSSYWNKIQSADIIVLNSHAYPEGIFNDLTTDKIRNLKKINCQSLIILGCNAGHYNYLSKNIAYEFSKKISGVVVASDGTVSLNFIGVYEPLFGSINDNNKYGYKYYLPESDKSRENLGWVLYKSNSINTTWRPTNLYNITMPSILDYLQNCGLVKF